ncbi:hypothetical protein VQ056_12305 [Paenibacillus sp. JTLBN-2024]
MHVQVDRKEDTGKKWPVVMPPSDQYMIAFGEQKIVIGATRKRHRRL